MEDILVKLYSSTSQYQGIAILTRLDHYRLLILTTSHPLIGKFNFTRQKVVFECEVLKCAQICVPHYSYFGRYVRENSYVTILGVDAGVHAIPIAHPIHGEYTTNHFYSSLSYKSTGIISNLNDSLILINTAYIHNHRGFITSQDTQALLAVIIPCQVSESFCLALNIYEILKDLIDPSISEVSLKEYEYDTILKVMGKGCQGSGVVISNNRIVTNLHVIKGGNSAAALYRGKWVTCKVIKCGVLIDLAILETDAELKPVEIAKEVREGQMVKAVGFCGFCIDESQAVISCGSLSKVIEINSKPIMLQTSAVIFNGCSGGAILNSSNQLLGIITSNARIGDKLFTSLNLAICQNVIFDDEVLLSTDKIYDDVQGYETSSIIPQYLPKL